MGGLTFGVIETLYKGYRFRSRLEARWAVFFDALGIEWQYEPEGFEVRYGPDCADVHRYLPDFYLPKSKTWAEVKGSDEALKKDAVRINAVVMSGALKGEDLLLLGPIPNRESLCLHPIHAAPGDGKIRRYAYFVPGGLRTIFLPKLAEVTGVRNGRCASAYDAARSVRFEHGENSGAVDRSRFTLVSDLDDVAPPPPPCRGIGRSLT